MSTYDKLIQKIFNGSSISYAEAEKILLGLDYKLRISGSHHVFSKACHKTIVLKKRSQFLTYQVTLLQEALIENGYEKKSKKRS